MTTQSVRVGSAACGYIDRPAGDMSPLPAPCTRHAGSLCIGCSLCGHGVDPKCETEIVENYNNHTVSSTTHNHPVLYVVRP